MKKQIKLEVYSALWCQPCQQLKKVLQDNEIPVDLLRVYDVDSSPDLAKDKGVRGIPTLILYEDDEEVKRATGIVGKKLLMEFIKERK